MGQERHLNEIIEIVNHIKSGNFNVNIPSCNDEELAKLANAIIELGKILERRFLEIKKINNVTLKVNSGFLLDEVLDFLFENFRDLIPYNRIGCSLLDENNEYITARWAKSDAQNIFLKKGYKSKLEGSTLKRIFETQEPRIINDLEEYIKIKPESESSILVLKEGVRSSLTCPLIVNAKPVGFLFFSSFEKNTYNNAHVSLYQQIAGQISVIIEKSKLYSEILVQKQKLEELNEIKNKFLGMAAHDLRNPLGVIMGFSQLLKMDYDNFTKEEILEIIDDISSASNTALNLVNDFLDVSKIESGTFEIHLQIVDFKSFIEQIVKKNSFYAKKKNIEIELKYSDEIPNIMIDSERLAQVFNNLITNSIKFSYRNSKISINVYLTNDSLNIDIIDYGIGMEQNEVEGIFNGFFGKGKPGTEGEKSTGLGLAISKKIVDSHNGKILVQSEKGKGSKFTVVLPISN
ncbi:MAG TPA: GAF domain-containing sensor histidine kinase [Bacteroidota bacterium]|jgi:signal transduction histidine kinase|nr:GAF domain-containing sensor histidine kinase [Bacteroidota bacterium]